MQKFLFLAFLFVLFTCSNSCPDGWVQSGFQSSKCYLIGPQRKNWLNAEIHCQNAHSGAHLTSICSAFENAYINALVSDEQTNSNLKIAGRVWIGLNDINTTGSFENSDGNTCVYRNWLPGQPNASLRTQCVSFLTRSSGKWTTENCATENYFVCALSEESETTSTKQTITSTAEVTPTSTTLANCGKRVLGYFTAWGTKPFSDHQANLLTNVVFAFATMAADGSLTIDDDARDRLSQLLSVARHHSGLRVQIAIGGGDSSQYFSAVVADPTMRAHFIASAVQLVTRNALDGIDIDWEFPDAGDRNNFVLLMQGLRGALDAKRQGYLLSFAGSAGRWALDPGYDLPGLFQYIDFANVMTYDYYGPWPSNTNTGPPGPLFNGAPSDVDPSGELNGGWTIQYYTKKTNLQSKINMGAPFYGYYWTDVLNAVDASDNCWRNFSSNGTTGSLSWQDIVTGSQFNVALTVMHPTAKVPYIWDAVTKTYLGYENVESIGYKANYVKTNDIGGIFVWSIDQDDDQDSMLTALANIC